MSERREPDKDWRADLARAFDRPEPGAEPRRDPPQQGPRPPQPPGGPSRGGGGRPGGGGGGGGGRWQGGPPGDGSLPPGYLRDGYFDADGYLRPELIVEQAREIAQTLAARGLSAASLRRFFGMARRAESRLEAEHHFAAVRGDLLALKPFAANAQTREVVPPVFREFIDRNVEHAVSSERDFLRGFLPHFQYVVAYFPRTR